MSSEATRTGSVGASIAPWLLVADGKKAVEFYGAAFGATEVDRVDDGAGGVAIARLTIGTATFWIQQDEENHPHAQEGQSPVRMMLTVEDPDPLFAQALEAGATEVFPISEDYGWRIGRVTDPFGYDWEVGKELVT
jgi:PhnB protein